MAKLDSLSQNIINNNSYAELFLNYKDYLNGGYTANAKRLLGLIEHKLLDEQKSNQLYLQAFKGSRNPKTIDMLFEVSDKLMSISEMINNVVKIKNSNNPKDIKWYLECNEDVVEKYTNLVTNQTA